ncbi:hypothetical protein BGW39_000089 [Mortierella sp. 14UC]|nr:hypothetical protein BGW39_000089 [Mortierella sp. 14UC]
MVRFTSLLIATGAIPTATASAQRHCGNKPKSIAKDKGKGKPKPKAKGGKFSSSEQKSILAAHNKVRARHGVAP